MRYTIPTTVSSARSITRAAESQIKKQTGIRVSLVLSSELTGQRSPEQMLHVVADALGMEHRHYQQKCRARDTVELRFIASRLLRTYYPGITLKRISAFFGGQDHSSVINGLERAESLLSVNDDIFTRKYERAQRAVRQWLKKELSMPTKAISA